VVLLSSIEVTEFAFILLETGMPQAAQPKMWLY